MPAQRFGGQPVSPLEVLRRGNDALLGVVAARARRLVALVLVQQGQVENGRRILESAMNELSAVPEVRYHYAVALMKTGEEKKAREIFAELLESDKPFDGRGQVEQIMK